MGANKIYFSAAISSIFILSSCSIVGDCRNEIEYRSPNPNGSYDVVVFSGNCGATSDHNVQVSIVEHGMDIAKEENGNILSAFGVGYTESIKPIWLSQNAINIYMYRDARIGFRKSAINGIAIKHILIKDVPAAN